MLQQRPTRAAVIEQLRRSTRSCAPSKRTLPPQFDRPGLNFSIAALPFFPVEDDGGVPALDIPPITGLVVIPGNIAFLNQFFSVLLMVTNVAPDGTPLELRESTATIVLPDRPRSRGAGHSTSPATTRCAWRASKASAFSRRFRCCSSGPTALRNTADDIASIPPQKKGEAEFLVEGLKEGSHLFDIAIQAMLYGLPSGPVKLMGQAAGAVFVRNPTFSVTLAHPRTVSSGERYDLYATVTNTSQSAANLVWSTSTPAASRARNSSRIESVTFDTIAAGQAATAKFTLIAQQTGEVTFSSFTGDAAPAAASS